MNKNKIEKIIHLMTKHTKQFEKPLMNFIIDEYGKKPFMILIGCLLSLRTKDTITKSVCQTLFKQAKTPQELLAIEPNKLEQLIFKTGFFKTKTKVLREVSKVIIEKFHNKVPKSVDELITIKGVGRKTANLVVGLAYNIPAICVDIHVHRISNRLGLIHTTNPYQTEIALEKIIPKKDWIIWNKLLVTWGQNVCTPRTPKCKECALNSLCKYGKKTNLRHLIDHKA